MRRFASLMTGLLGLLLAAAPAAAQDGTDDPGFLRVGVGYYDINDDMDAGEFHVEYISGDKLWIFNPFVGVMGTTDAAIYGYAGIRLDVFLGRRWVFTPSFAPGLYSDGDGKEDLVDHIKQMDRGGIDMSAYRGEPNHDDNVDKYGKDKKPDGLRGDGT